jgi:hypothetical protein
MRLKAPGRRTHIRRAGSRSDLRQGELASAAHSSADAILTELLMSRFGHCFLNDCRCQHEQPILLIDRDCRMAPSGFRGTPDARLSRTAPPWSTIINPN